MQTSTSPLITALVVLLTMAVSLADVVLPRELEVDFFYTLPILLCMKTGRPNLPYLVAAFAAAWTIAVDAYMCLALTPPAIPTTYEIINDLFGFLAVCALAVFVAGRMRKEGEFKSIIGFIDGHLAAPDNDRLRKLL